MDCRKWLLLVLIAGIFSAPARASEEPPDLESHPSEDLQRVLASVDGVPIQLGEVRQELHALLHDREPQAAKEAGLLEEMLAQIVRRRYALVALKADGRAAGDDQVDEALSAYRARFAQQGESLDTYLRQNGIAPESFRERIRWELSWAAYKENVLTEENLERFFERYRRHFDGTEVRASHVLLAANKVRSAEFGVRNEEDRLPDAALGTSNSELEQLLARAREIRAQIEASEMTFAEAAERYSMAPSRDRGGDIGYFSRRGVMHESFAAAAFGLKPGEISQPVVTPFGIHLIQVTDERSGHDGFSEVREEVFAAAEARLFDLLVRRGREISAGVPHDQQQDQPAGTE